MTDESQISESERVGHETTDAEVGLVVKFGIFLIVVSVAVAVVVAGFHKYLNAREAEVKAPRYPLAVGRTPSVPPPPRLQTYPFSDITELRREENRLLNRYGWVDRNAGIVRIPVERAIELLAERGLPHRSAAEAAEQAAPGTTAEATPPGTVTEENAPETGTEETAPAPAPAPDAAAAPVP